MTNTPLSLKMMVCIWRLLPMTFFSTKYKVLSQHFGNTLIAWFIHLTEISNCWKACFFIVVAFVKEAYSISWSQFEIWIIIVFTMLIVMFFWSLRCNFDKSKVCWIWQFIKFWIFTLDFLSMLFANDAEDCLICHGVNFCRIYSLLL